jgi:CheY-like chemotaxis protein
MGYDKLIIGVTGSALDTDIQEFEAAGADMVFAKPVNMESLNQLLEYCSEEGYQSNYSLVSPGEISPVEGIEQDEVSSKKD